MQRLAVISSHPIQYYAPWFRYIADETDITLKVFYLWDFGITKQVDSDFKQAIKWDIPLLEGYEYEFVQNTSKKPGTSYFWGLQNPTLIQQVHSFKPAAVLMMNYNYASLYRFIWQWDNSSAPLLFRGDSHRLFSVSGLKENLRRQWISTVYQQFNAFLYVGKANYQYFVHHGVSSDALFCSPHSIDNQRFSSQSNDAQYQSKIWKAQLGIPESHQVILFAGKFSDKKRPLDLLKAFLRASIQQASLLFVGAGPLEAKLKTAAAKHPNIYFAPFQNQTSMPRTYAASDIFVLPSYGNGETWGLAINEAMCLSRPVIVSDHVGCAQDLVQHEHNGLVFPAGNIEALAQALTKALEDPLRLKKWGNNSYKTIQQYSYVQTTAGLKQALAQVKKGLCLPA